jgi:hypothetical protein
MAPEEKEALKTKMNKTGATIKETFEEVEETIVETYAQVKEKVKKEASDMNR